MGKREERREEKKTKKEIRGQLNAGPQIKLFQLRTRCQAIYFIAWVVMSTNVVSTADTHSHTLQIGHIAVVHIHTLQIGTINNLRLLGVVEL